MSNITFKSYRTPKQWEFPGGEVGVKIEDQFAGQVDIVARIKSSDDILALAQVKEILDQRACDKVNLLLPYVPYSRQDRPCDKGESFSLKVFAKILNGMEFDRVKIIDPHSDVSTALIENVQVITQDSVIGRFPELNSFIRDNDCVFVSPDAGANKKTLNLAKKFNHHAFIRADKVRDVKDGSIKETFVYSDDLAQKTCIIADDICDGGRTFIELAKVLKQKNSGMVILYVTHGIFSQGTQKILESGIDQIWTTNSLYTEQETEKVSVLNIESF